MEFNPDALSSFLRAVMAPGDCLEMRIFEADYASGGYVIRGDRFSRVFAGWYNSPESLVCDARRLRGVSGFLIPNPTIPDMLACSDNKLKVVKKATKDEHIRCLRWIYLDFDAKKPSDDMSASDAERAEALAKRDAVLAQYPKMAESSLWGSSGNGGWILVRLDDLPNTEENRATVAKAIDYFVEHHGADPKTKNPARLMPLVGSMKCKGSSVPDRPWRPVTFDGNGRPK